MTVPPLLPANCVKNYGEETFIVFLTDANLSRLQKCHTYQTGEPSTG